MVFWETWMRLKLWYENESILSEFVQLIFLIFHKVKHNIKKLLLLSVHNISRALNAP